MSKKKEKKAVPETEVLEEEVLEELGLTRDVTYVTPEA